MADDDLWHVRIAADDVKILPLEKLDDLFRLEVIDADTLVWQPGMDEWLPLRVVAGIADDSPEVVNIAVSEPPPRPVAAVTSTAWPPQAVTKQTASSWPPQVGSLPPLTPPPPSLSRTAALPSRPALPPPSSRAPVSQAPVSGGARESAWPAPSAWQPLASPASPFAPTVSAAQFAPYADVPAQASVDTDVRRPRRGGGRWVVIAALAAGTAVTLYRNAVVHAAATSMGQERSYLSLETALGGPSFGTPRAVERMTESSKALLEGAAKVLASTTTTTTTSAPAGTVPAVMAPSTAAPVPATTAGTPGTAATPPPASPKRAEASPKAAGATRPASVSAAMSRPAVKESDSVFGSSKKSKKSKGNEFDPLNPNL